MSTGTVVAVHGAVPAAVGFPVCLLGQASGWHCGTITATDQTVQYDQGLVSGLTATSVCSDAGDSGGAFISGDQAQGVVSGGIGDCSANGTTYFQPLAPIPTTYGLTLQTGYPASARARSAAARCGSAAVVIARTTTTARAPAASTSGTRQTSTPPIANHGRGGDVAATARTSSNPGAWRPGLVGVGQHGPVQK